MFKIPILIFSILHLFHYGVYCDDLCSWVNETSEHLLCKHGFIFPLDGKLENIQKLTIHSENLTDIKTDDLKNLPDLKYLDVSKSNVKNIDQDAFINNKHLETINLSHNKDLIIPKDGPFFDSKSLRVLILKNVSVTTLPEEALKEMPNLQILNLQDNKLEDIEKAIENAKSIEELKISESNLEPNVLCDRTSLAKVVIVTVNEKKEEVSKVTSCVTPEEQPQETTTKQEEVTTEVTTIVTNEELHKTFCNDDKNFAFEGKMECTEEDNARSCTLSCPDGTKADTDLLNPYKCLYSTGIISPTIPKCLKEESNLTYLTNVSDVVEKSLQTLDENGQEEKEATEKPTEKTEIEVDENKLDTLQAELNSSASLEDERIGESKPEESGVNGSSVVLGIIIVVLVLGALGMGYKYWKNHRGYHNTKTEDVEEGKELKTINSANKTLVEQNDDQF